MAKILLVDDDEQFRSMLRRSLQRVGHDVIDAAEGGAALRLLDGATVDLMITDIFMPNMDGIETIQALRTTHPELKVIAMSGGGRMKQGGYLAVAKYIGAVRVFSKPFDHEKLFAAIDDVLKL